MNGPMNVFSGEAAGPNCRVRGRRGGGGGGQDGDGGAPGEAHRGQPGLRRVRAGRAGVAVRRPRPRAMRGWSSGQARAEARRRRSRDPSVLCPDAT